MKFIKTKPTTERLESEIQRLNANIETLNDLLSEFTRVFGGVVQRSDEKRRMDELRRQFMASCN